VLAAVRRDAAAGRTAAWASSTVEDEHVGGPVVPRDVVDALHRAADLPHRHPVGNAGLLHVYGYWFSDVATPFGFKRDRWAQGELAAALGLPRDAFLLDHDSGTTLLERVTRAVGPLLGTRHRGPVAGDAPDAVGSPGRPAVRSADAWVDGVLTRAVTFRAPGARATALVHGLDDGHGMRLVTTFPVDGDARALLAEFAAEPRLRWNAVVLAQP
jgi:hypothetical protein